MNAVTLEEIQNYDSRPQKSGDEARFLCSLSDVCRSKPRDGEHRSLCVNTRTGFYVCHRCGAKGKLKDFWEERPRLNKKQVAHAKLSAQFSAPVKTKKEDDANSEHLSENYVEKFKSYKASFIESQAEEYLQGRGILPEIAREAGCGYATAWEHWEKRETKWLLTGVDRRVVFPIYDQRGELVAIHGRAIEEKHFNSSKITKGDKSLGIFAAQPEALKAKVVAICEGAIDALALASCGVAAVAMTGTTAPDWLFKKLAFKHVLLATDADEAGDKAADKLKFELEKYGAKTFRLRPRRAKDWGEIVQTAGAEKMRPFLEAFGVGANDELKVDSAWRFFQENREETAIFIAQTIGDLECRELLLERIRKNRPAE
jgi:DNA primase